MSMIRQKLALHWGRKVLSRFVRDDVMQPRSVAVMMPLAPKDLARARVSIPKVQAMLMHPIASFQVVSPACSEIADLCAELGVTHVEETAPLVHIMGEAGCAGASGWIRQQMLKLGAPEVTGHDGVVTMDADTYPIRPTAFTHGAQTILYRGDRNAEPFHRFTEALIGPCPSAHVSFVAHCMLFEADPLGALRAAIEDRHQVPWADAIAATLAQPEAEVGRLSEFDLYGHFMLRARPDTVTTRYYANIKAPPEEFRGERPLAAFRQRFRFISNHQRG